MRSANKALLLMVAVFLLGAWGCSQGGGSQSSARVRDLESRYAKLEEDHRATVAAREGAKGADADELVTIVERVLEGHRIEIGDDATLVLEQGLTVQTRGQLPCTPPEEPLVDGDEVRVTVCVSLAAPPFLNLLRTYGIDLEGRTFTISSVATIE